MIMIMNWNRKQNGMKTNLNTLLVSHHFKVIYQETQCPKILSQMEVKFQMNRMGTCTNSIALRKC